MSGAVARCENGPETPAIPDWILFTLKQYVHFQTRREEPTAKSRHFPESLEFVWRYAE